MRKKDKKSKAKKQVGEREARKKEEVKEGIKYKGIKR